MESMPSCSTDPPPAPAAGAAKPARVGASSKPKPAAMLSTVKGAIGAEDMIKLHPLEEETLLNNLERRFKAELVYTYIGDIVVSVNPFKRTGNSTAEVQQKYVESLRKHEPSSALPPRWSEADE